MHGHRLAEERSIALHRAVTSKLRADPRLIDGARRRVEEWRARGTVAPYYAEEWVRLLSEDLDELCAMLVDRGERARALRQVSPFAGVLDARERWRILRDMGAARARSG